MFNKILFCSLLITMGVFSTATANAVDPVTATVGAGVVKVTGVADDIMESAADNANYVVFSAAAEAKMLIESFRLSAKNTLTHGFDKLDDSQQQVFNNIESTLATLQIAVNKPIEESRQMIEEIHQISDDILNFNKSPSILRSSPTVIGSTNLNDIVFKFRGLSLDNAKPKLFFGNNEATRIDLKKQEVTFTVPSKIFSHLDKKSNYVKGKILLHDDDCSFLIFCEKSTKEFEVGVLILPLQLAKVQASYNTINLQKVYSNKPFSRTFSVSTGSLVETKCNTNSQGAHAPLYFIDLKTLREIKVNRKGESKRKIVNQSPAGFSVETCAKALMHTVFKKKDGLMRVTMGWKEYKNEDVVGKDVHIKFNNENLQWNTQIEKKFPKDTHTITLKVDYFDGTSAIVNGSYQDKYIKASWNNSTKHLVIRPTTPSTVMGIY